MSGLLSCFPTTLGSQQIALHRPPRTRIGSHLRAPHQIHAGIHHSPSFPYNASRCSSMFGTSLALLSKLHETYGPPQDQIRSKRSSSLTEGQVYPRDDTLRQPRCVCGKPLQAVAAKHTKHFIELPDLMDESGMTKTLTYRSERFTMR